VEASRVGQKEVPVFAGVVGFRLDAWLISMKGIIITLSDHMVEFPKKEKELISYMHNI